MITAAWANTTPTTPAEQTAHDWKILGVETYFFGAERFDRISEYFTGKENTGWYLYVRSDPKTRPGYYFKVNFNHRCMDLPEGSQFTIPASDMRYPTSVYLGFTGKDAPGAQAIAWKITLMIPNTAPIVLKSPLWEMP
ncbi:MAG TPA: hypothetical protein PLV25_00495 [Opitutales bacterium]|nr:hypothetical protein [Opitutales bacterium]